MARLLDLGGLNCPPAVEELELFADAADENLLAWAFCGREASQVDLVRWAQALTRELPEIGGTTFLPRGGGSKTKLPWMRSRWRNSARRQSDIAPNSTSIG